MDKNSDKNKKLLHGNKAKINPDQNVVPRFTGYVLNDNYMRHGVVFNRLEDDAEFCKKEVDDNKK